MSYIPICVDIIEEILPHIADDKNTLRSAALVASAWRHPAQRQIFKCFGYRLRFSENIYWFLQFLQKSPHICRLVWHFSISSGPYEFNRACVQEIRSVSLCTLYRILGHFPVLRSVSLTHMRLIDCTLQRVSGFHTCTAPSILSTVKTLMLDKIRVTGLTADIYQILSCIPRLNELHLGPIFAHQDNIGDKTRPQIQRLDVVTVAFDKAWGPSDEVNPHSYIPLGRGIHTLSFLNIGRSNVPMICSLINSERDSLQHVRMTFNPYKKGM